MVSNFYGTEIEIWAGFEPVDSTEKKNGPMKTFEGFFFHVFRGKKIMSNLFIYVVAFALKSCIN